MSLKSAITISRHFPAFGLGRGMDRIGVADLAVEESHTTTRISARNITLIKALNDALRDELTCALRDTGHSVNARRLALPMEADRFQRYAAEESLHARRLTERIVQLGGEADVVPESVARRGAVVLDDATDLREMIRSSLSAEGESIDIYCRILNLVSEHDMPTQSMVEDIMIEVLQHAEELWDWQPDHAVVLE